MSKVLIVYATQTNTTYEVAEKVKEVLITQGHEVDINDIKNHNDFSNYDTILIGAPVNGMMWRPDAFEYVKAHQGELANKKVAYFALAMLAKQGRSFFRSRVNNALLKPSQIVKPIDTAVFGGVANGELPGFARFLFGMEKDSKVDQRDWDEIEIWAKRLASRI